MYFFLKFYTDQRLYECYSTKKFPTQSFGSCLTLWLSACLTSYTPALIYTLFIFSFVLLGSVTWKRKNNSQAGLYRRAGRPLSESRFTYSGKLPRYWSWISSGSYSWPGTCVFCQIECLDVWGLANNSAGRRGGPSKCWTRAKRFTVNVRLGHESVRVASCANARVICGWSTETYSERDSQCVGTRLHSAGWCVGTWQLST